MRSQPGTEGKWFAAAKHAGLFDAAIDLAQRSPTDPRTLTRAARDYPTDRPGFAMPAGMAALHWIASGYGCDITGADVVDAYQAVLRAARCAGVEDQQVQAQVTALIAQRPGNAKFMLAALASLLPN